MLFSGYVSSVSKPFELKSKPNTEGCFFTLMVNSGEKSAKYIKCLTYSKSLITVLLQSTKNTIILVENGYPDTSYSKEYVNTATQKEGVYLQHFVVTGWSEYGVLEIHEQEEKILQDKLDRVRQKIESQQVTEPTTKTFEWDWDLDDEPKGNND